MICSVNTSHASSRICTRSEGAVRSTQTRIPLSVPLLAGNEAAYLNACVEENWVAANGRFTRAFEEAFAARHGVEEVVLYSPHGDVVIHP